MEDPSGRLLLRPELRMKRVMHVDARDVEDFVLLKHLPECVAFISSSLAEGKRCLVHCLAGVSRSATVRTGNFAVVLKDMKRSCYVTLLLAYHINSLRHLWKWTLKFTPRKVLNARWSAVVGSCCIPHGHRKPDGSRSLDLRATSAPLCVPKCRLLGAGA